MLLLRCYALALVLLALGTCPGRPGAIQPISHFGGAYGVGHSATVSLDNTDHLVFHACAAHNQDRPKLRLEPLQWSAEGWPTVAATP